MNEGDSCTINNNNDLFMRFEAREFIGKTCVIVKHTKSGLIQISLKDNPKITYSVPKRNVDPLCKKNNS